MARPVGTYRSADIRDRAAKVLAEAESLLESSMSGPTAGDIQVATAKVALGDAYARLAASVK